MHKKTITLIVTLFFTLTLATLPESSSAKSSQPFKMVTLLDFKPFIWCENETAKGIDIDILAELFKRVDRSYSIECLPWKRALKYLEVGDVDGLFSAYKTEEREKFAVFLDRPLHFSEFSVFVRKGEEFEFKKLEQLFGKRIGITRGYSINEEFDAARKNNLIEISESPTTEVGLQMLLKRRIDAYVNSKHVTQYTAKKLGFNQKITPLTHPLHTPRPAYLMISKNSKLQDRERLIDSLNKALRELWEDGTITRIIESYTIPVKGNAQ